MKHQSKLNSSPTSNNPNQLSLMKTTPKKANQLRKNLQKMINNQNPSHLLKTRKNLLKKKMNRQNKRNQRKDLKTSQKRKPHQ